MHPHDNNDGQYTRRVVLPSGRTIDVVYFENGVAEQAAKQTPDQREDKPPGVIESAASDTFDILAAAARDLFWMLVGVKPPDEDRPATSLHCPDCGTHMVNYIDWEPVDKQYWWAQLRCLDCESFFELEFDDTIGARLDGEFLAERDVLIRDFEDLAHANFVYEIEAILLPALDAGAVGWEDLLDGS